MKPTPACTLTDAEETRLSILLEQIGGCTELLYSRIPAIEKDTAATTAVNIVAEKAAEAFQIVRAGCKAGKR